MTANEKETVVQGQCVLSDLALCNYKESKPEVMKPYEARVYRWNK